MFLSFRTERELKARTDYKIWYAFSVPRNLHHRSIESYPGRQSFVDLPDIGQVMMHIWVYGEFEGLIRTYLAHAKNTQDSKGS